MVKKDFPEARSEERAMVFALYEKGVYFTCRPDDPETLYELLPWNEDVAYLPFKEKIAFVRREENGDTWIDFSEGLCLAPNQISCFKRQLDAVVETGKFLNLLDA